MPLQSINPFNNEIIATYDEYSDAVVDLKIKQTHEAWPAWKKLSFQDRSEYVSEIASVLRSRSAELAKVMALEMGKPVKAGRAEIEKCAACCDYYAEHAAQFLSEEVISTEAQRSFVSFEPIGVVLAIMPWNFPFWQLFRFLAPALMAGNTGVLKHASNVSGCALVIEDVVREAGLPEHVFQTLLVSSSRIDRIIENPLVKAVTLTGSTGAGQKVAAKAASVLKKSVLELGGSDAYLILEDADLDYAAKTCADSRLINSGQSCIAAKRFIVVEPVAEEFIKRFKASIESRIVGDPLAENTEVGPQARTDLRDNLHEQVTKSVEMGANILLGGKVSEGNHAFYPPTLLTNVTEDMPVFVEETFGPVAAVIVAKDEADAIRLANKSQFGLGAAIFSRDIAKAEKIATKQVEAGSCFVNDFVKSDVRLPFGGSKQSGFGRELGVYGIKEFVNIKTVSIK